MLERARHDAPARRRRALVVVDEFDHVAGLDPRRLKGDAVRIAAARVGHDEHRARAAGRVVHERDAVVGPRE